MASERKVRSSYRDIIHKQKNQNIMLETRLFNKQLDCKELQNRISKAIEYLNKECMYDKDLGYCDDLWCGEVQELVNILKGDDKE